MRVALLPVAGPEESVLRDLKAGLEGAGLEIDLLPLRALPKGAYDASRDQYRADRFLVLARRVAKETVLAVTDVDLYAKPLNFVFGQAEMGGRSAVISLHRLRSEERPLFLERAVKEAVHELGHTQGLEHCARSACVMHFSRDLEDTDRKGPGFCPPCGRRLGIPLDLPGPP